MNAGNEMAQKQDETEFQAAVQYLLERMASHERLRHLMIGTESYSKLVCAYASSYGQIETLGSMPEILPPGEILSRIERP